MYCSLTPTLPAQLLSVGTITLGVMLPGPLIMLHNGAVVTCEGIRSSTGISLNATLTVLGG